MRPRVERRELPFELGQRADQLLASGVMCGRFELSSKLCASQAQRLGAPQLLGIVCHLRHRAARALLFAFIHAFLDSILGVD
jgi:hypothetical protein